MGLTLVVRHGMASLVDAREAEITILAHFAVLFAAVHEGRVARGAELRGVFVLKGEADGFAAKPVADVVCIDAVSEQGAED